MKIIAGMATTGNRAEQLHRAIDSLSTQVDELVLYDNSQGPDKTDLGKFYGLTLQSEPCIYFSVDDDIIYPQNYVSETLRRLEQFSFAAIVTYHGRILYGPGRDYYHGHRAFSCRYSSDIMTRLDVAGTGVSAFSTEYFNPLELHADPVTRASDLVFSLAAAKAEKNIIHLPHRAGWLQMQPVPVADTCFYNESKNPEKLTALADQIWTLNYQKQRTT